MTTPTMPISEMKWTLVSDNSPPPHARYKVRGAYGKPSFLATPCYGLHMPWWVPFIDGKEVDPIDMRQSDQWASLTADTVAAVQPISDEELARIRGIASKLVYEHAAHLVNAMYRPGGQGYDGMNLVALMELFYKAIKDADEERAHQIEDDGVIERLRAGTATRDEMFDVANSLCYLWAQDGLLSEAQETAKKAESDLASAKQPLDAQMARLNETLIAANNANISLTRDLTTERAAREAAERERDGIKELVENATREKRLDGKTLLDFVYVWRDQEKDRADKAERQNEALVAAITEWRDAEQALCDEEAGAMKRAMDANDALRALAQSAEKEGKA